MMDLTEQEAEEIDEFLNSKAFITPVISAQNLCSINSCPDKQMYRARIQYLFQVDAYVQDENGEINEDAKDVLIDMIHDAILFVSDNQFSYAKSILFLTIYIAIFQQVILRPFFEPDKVYKQYEKCLLMHSVERPPFSVAIFSLPDIKIIHEYFILSFFRNLKFIMNCFTKEPRVMFTYKEPGIFKLPTLLPLSEMVGDFKPPVKVEPPKNTLSEQPTPISKGTPSPKTSSSMVSRSVSDDKQQKDQHPPPTQKDIKNQQTPQKEAEQHTPDPHDRGPDVPMDALRETLSTMHMKFVHDFDEKERLLVGKIKELEIKMADKQAAAQAAAAKKLPLKSPKK